MDEIHPLASVRSEMVPDFHVVDEVAEIPLDVHKLVPWYVVKCTIPEMWLG